MSRSNAEREREMIRRIRAVVACKSSRFKDILEAAEINPKSGLRFRNLSGLSFAGQDLRGMDLTGSNLAYCRFDDALIERARFDYCRLGELSIPFRSGATSVEKATANLEFAKDWKQFFLRKMPPVGAKFNTNQLPVGAVFQPANSAPQFVKLPRYNDASYESGLHNRDLAMSKFAVGTIFFEAFRRKGGASTNIAAMVMRDEADQFCSKLSQMTGRRIRLPTALEIRSAHSRGFFDANQLSVFETLNDEASREEDAEGGISEWCADFDGPLFPNADQDQPIASTVLQRSTFHAVMQLD